MVKMMSDNDSKESPADTFELAAAPDEVSAKLVQGEVDIAAVPANLASVLYNKTNGGVQVLAVNTLGVLYIVEDGDTVHSIADLKGRTIYAGGKGATPEYALNYILEKNGLVPGEDVTIEWKSEHAECVAALAEDADGIAMLPQPFVTTAQTKKETLRTALDLTEEWNKIQESEGTASTLVTGVTVVRTAFAKEHPELLAEWDASKNDRPPEQYAARSNAKVWWECKQGHQWQATPDSRSQGSGCPVCAREQRKRNLN